MGKYDEHKGFGAAEIPVRMQGQPSFAPQPSLFPQQSKQRAARRLQSSALAPVLHEEANSGVLRN